MVADGVHETGKAEAPPLAGQVIDMTDPANTATYQKMTTQTQLRDRLADSPQLWRASLECTDTFASQPGSCYIAPRNSKDQVFSTRVADHLPAWPTKAQRRISSDVAERIVQGNPRSSLAGWKLDRDIWLGLFLNKETSAPPMKDSFDSYSETVTRPFEKELLGRLMHSTGQITHADLIKQSLEVCQNDQELALLTLSNFTKNMAAVERRQVWPEVISPELRDSYTKQNIDSIFARIEGFADDGKQKYNKEGAIYHFYGAMYAASRIGEATYSMAGLENLMFGHDRLEDAAAYQGVMVGEAANVMSSPMVKPFYKQSTVAWP